MSEIFRRKTVTVTVGNVRVGSDAPVVVQSMTNTDTADIAGTIQQVAALAAAGSELVRVTVKASLAPGPGFWTVTVHVEVVGRAVVLPLTVLVPVCR